MNVTLATQIGELARRSIARTMRQPAQIVPALVFPPFLLVGLTAGAHIAAGVGGVLVIFALSFLMTLGFGAIGSAAALRTGSGEAVQGLFPLFFVLLFLSSMSLPRDLIQTDWFREIATWNPVSYLIEALRSLLITGWDGEALALGFAVAVGLIAVGTVLASLALRTRLVRT